jgi:hypothetical protein
MKVHEFIENETRVDDNQLCRINWWNKNCINEPNPKKFRQVTAKKKRITAIILFFPSSSSDMTKSSLIGSTDTILVPSIKSLQLVASTSPENHQYC